MLSNEEFRALIMTHNGYGVSLYMPVERGGTEVRKNTILFKNLIRKAEGKLQQYGVKKTDATAFFQPVSTTRAEDIFQQKREDGLAVFVQKDFVRYYQFPCAFHPRVDVGRHFLVLPLLPLFTLQHEYLLLALSRRSVRLYEGGIGALRDITPKNIPLNIDEALPYEDPEKSLQWHTGTPHGRGERPAMFHGHGAKADAEKEWLIRFCRRIDNALRDVIMNDPRPVIPVGVESLLAIFRNVTQMTQLVSGQIETHADELSIQELQQRAEGIMARRRNATLGEARRRCRERLETGKQASDRIEEVVPAAYDGKVETLFVPSDERVMGYYDPSARSVKTSDTTDTESEDMLNLAAIHTYEHGGYVHVVPREHIPSVCGSPCAAVLRR